MQNSLLNLSDTASALGIKPSRESITVSGGEMEIRCLLDDCEYKLL
jgi:hypothetical protein